MTKPAAPVARILDRLEEHYGKLKPKTPAGAYEMVIYANCGYPANDATCAKGFEALKKRIGTAPDKILAAPEKELRDILRLVFSSATPRRLESTYYGAPAISK